MKFLSFVTQKIKLVTIIIKILIFDDHDLVHKTLISFGITSTYHVDVLVC